MEVAALWEAPPLLWEAPAWLQGLASPPAPAAKATTGSFAQRPSSSDESSDDEADYDSSRSAEAPGVAAMDSDGSSEAGGGEDAEVISGSGPHPEVGAEALMVHGIE